jgi:flagellin-like hook-associated protein FlgL
VVGVDLAHSDYTGTSPTGGFGYLDIEMTLAGVASPYTGISPVVGTDMTALAAALSGNISSTLSSLQGGSGAGEVTVADNVRPNGPASESDIQNLDIEDIYASATDDQTKSKLGIVDKSKEKTLVASAGTASASSAGESNFGAWALASAINHNENSQFWAMVQNFDSNGNKAEMVYIFTKVGGNFTDLLACDVAGNDPNSRDALDAVGFENVSSTEKNDSGTTFTLGGEKWAQMKPTQTKANLGNEVWNVTLNGRDVGSERDLRIANADEIATPALEDKKIINGMDRNSFVEIQNAADGPWKGAEIRTQSAAQEALDAITESINSKDKIRADLGALQNRLENTMTNLTVQAENLQASESRISDVDVATEMTEFTRNNVLAQAATSMLAQANSLSQLALSLIG